MACYKPQNPHSLLLPVFLGEQIIPGTSAFGLKYLADQGLGLANSTATHRHRGRIKVKTQRGLYFIEPTIERLVKSRYAQ